MADALFQLFFRFPVVLVAEILLIVILSRSRVRRRLLWVIGSYLLLVAAALAFALIGRDEFGFGFIPLIVMTAPWQLLPIRMPSGIFSSDLLQIALGLILNCALFYILGQLGYPKHSTKPSGRHAT